MTKYLYEIGNEKVRNNRYPMYCDICNAGTSNNCICKNYKCDQCDSDEHLDFIYQYLDITRSLLELCHSETQRSLLESADIN